MNDDVFIIGHKNPDLDSIASAIVLSYYKKLKGLNWIPTRSGEVDEETKFVLNKFGFKIPELITNISGKKVCLVDHCSIPQTVNGFENAEIVEVIDHHNISDVKTAKPIRYHCEPVGSTCSIIASYFFIENLEMSKNIASLVLSAMISDTDLFKSPTTTEFDLILKKMLEKISKINIQELGIELFKVKSNMDNKTISEIVLDDSKEYDFNGIKSCISQIKLMDLDGFLKIRRKQVLDFINQELIKKKYELFVCIITDLIKEGSEVFVVGKTEFFEKKFNVKINNNSIFIQGLLSRKKQIVPKLMDSK